MLKSPPKQTLFDVESIWNLLDLQTKKKFLKLTFAITSVNILDILGIFLFATFASGIFNLVQQSASRTRLELAVETWLKLDLERIPFLSIVACAMLISFILKSGVSAFLNRKTLFFLAYRESVFAALVLKRHLKKNAELFYQKSPEEIHYAVGISVSRIFNGVLFPLSQLINDGALLLFIFLALLYTSPSTTILGAGMIGFAILFIGKKVHKATTIASQQVVKNSLIVQESTRELYDGYRELVTKSYANFNEEKFETARNNLSIQQARLLWLQQIPRYSLEILVILSAAALSTFEFILNDTRTALVKLSIFIVTVFRMLPSIQRIQSSTLAINSGLVAARPSLEILKDKDQLKNLKSVEANSNVLKNVEIGTMEFSDLSYKYRDSERFTFQGLDGIFEMCSFVGLLGESGVGKSTLVDCIARLREPTRGYIVFKSVSGKTIQPSIAYVPQKPFIANSDVLTNIALEKHVSKAKIAEIEVLFNFFFRELSEERTDRDLRLDSNLAQSLNSLSGGQTQRISIMRALLSQSDFIIFDECFSGLSEKMTRDIVAYLRVNYPKTTFLVISHSVSTLKNCDVIYRLEAKQLSRIEV